MHKKRVESVLSHEITRLDFLKATGTFILVIAGLPALLNSIVNAFGSQKSRPPQSSGYGGRSYGK